MYARKLVVLVSLAFAFAAQAFAAEPAAAVTYAWTPQNSGTTTQLERIFFRTTSQGWAVGDGGTILATIDGGQTWSPQTSGSGADLTDVFFIDSSHGWAVGTGGAIITTSDGGASWSAESSGTTANLWGVRFVDASHGWIAGGSGILTTTNGGSTWTQQSTTTTCLLGLSVVDANHAWAAACDGTILATTNGGTTWTTQSTGQSNALYSVSFVDANNGWAVGDGGTILATTDGGTTWTPQASGLISENLRSVSFATATQGAAVGDQGVPWFTSDGGATWTMEAGNDNGNALNGVSFPDPTQPNIGWAAGSNGTIVERTIAPPAPIVTSVTPNTGSDLGNTSVTIQGSSFTNAFSIYFGATKYYLDTTDPQLPPGTFRVDSNTQITATTAEIGQATAAVNVSVVTPGGTSPSTPSDQFTFFSPPGGQWTLTGSLNTGRAYQTATLLPSGKVLVAGGMDNNYSALASAELYDPTTGLWTPTGSMSQARSWATATLLSGPNCGSNCGKVLVAGGEVGDEVGLSSAELYDPASGQWTSAGSMTVGRASATATLLTGANCGSNCGKVLVAGGYATGGPYSLSSQYLTTTELYDPATNTWAATGSMNQGRAFHTATLLSGPACAGSSPPSYCDKVLVVGGDSGYYFSQNPPGGAAEFAQPELYDPTTGRWSPTAPENPPREWATSALLADGKVLSAGGYNNVAGANGLGCFSDVYDPASASWTAAGRMQICNVAFTVQNGDATATLLPSGQVLVAGGNEQGISGPSTIGAQIFDPAAPTGSNPWSLVASMNVPRDSHTATLLDVAPCAPNCGKVLVVGGTTETEGLGGAYASAELFTPPLPAVALSPPVNTSPPSISGQAVAGQTLTVAQGSWSNSPTSYAHQWQRCDSAGKSCVAITAATLQSYTLTAGDVGSTVRVQETASNAAAAGAPASSTQTAVVTAPSATPPQVTGYRITNNPFVVGAARTPLIAFAAAKKHKKGTTFKYTLSEAATVKIAISRRLAGRRRGGRCVAPTKKLRKAKACVRVTLRGTLTRTSHHGANSVAFSGRIGLRALKPGNYQATLTATDKAMHTSRAQTIHFTIVVR